MIKKKAQIIAIVRRESRLEGLKRRMATAGSAAFRMKSLRSHESQRRQKKGFSETQIAALAAVDQAAEFSEYESEDQALKSAAQELASELEVGLPVIEVDRSEVSRFDFGRCAMVAVVGQDGLVANVAKYVDGCPILGINPDANRYDGILLPFQVRDARNMAVKCINGTAAMRDVSMAEASLNDGQRLMAFNDFFIGCNSHQSARYTLQTPDGAEVQSSSGILVSTGAGSTGWMSSVMNMTRGLVSSVEGHAPSLPSALEWEARKLRWAVREPFVSRSSSARYVYGEVGESQEIVVESLMPRTGVVFSDGIENDFLEFNSGSVVRIRLSSQCARLIVPSNG